MIMCVGDFMEVLLGVSDVSFSGGPGRSSGTDGGGGGIGSPIGRGIGTGTM